MKLWQEVTYKGFKGTVIAKQPSLPGIDEPLAYLVSFGKPANEERIPEYIATFGLNSKQLGPSVNRLILTTELEFEDDRQSRTNTP